MKVSLFHRGKDKKEMKKCTYLFLTCALKMYHRKMKFYSLSIQM